MRRLIFIVIFAVSIVAAPPRLDAAGGSCPQYEKALAKYLPAKTVKTFSRIAWRESRCNPKSVSAVRRSTGYPDVGLLQIQGSWRTVTVRICRPKGSHIAALTRLDCHLRVARYLYDNGGLGHWRATSGQ